MMKSAKIIVFALSLALLIGAMVGFSVSAEGTAPEIVSKNIKVDGNFSLMFAVDPATVEGSDVTINIYNKAPAADVAAIQTITKAKADTQKIDLDADGTAEFDAIVFETKGVSAKDIADVWYITTTSAGVTSEPVTYSVREYAFERLYKNGTIFAAETDEDTYKYDQQQFYLEILDVGSAAQQLLVNYNNPTPEKLAKEYTYAAVVGGTFTLGEATESRGFVNVNDVLTLTSTDDAVKAWDVYTFGQNGGQISVQTVADGGSVTVKGNIAAVPYVMGVTPGHYFDEIGNSIYNFTNVTYKNFVGESGDDLIGKTNYGNTSSPNFYEFKDCGNVNYGNVLSLNKTADVGTQSLIHFPIAAATDENANCAVFEFDFLYTGMNVCYSSATTPGSIASNGTFYFSMNNADLQTAHSKTWNGLQTYRVTEWSMNTYDLDGVTEKDDTTGYYVSPKGDNSMRLPGSTKDLAANTWYNICIEVYADAGKWIMYIDGVQVSSGNVTSYDISNYNTISFMWDYRLRNYDMMFDNVYGGRIVKECPIK